MSWGLNRRFVAVHTALKCDLSGVFISGEGSIIRVVKHATIDLTEATVETAVEPTTVETTVDTSSEPTIVDTTVDASSEPTAVETLDFDTSVESTAFEISTIAAVAVDDSLNVSSSSMDISNISSNSDLSESGE